MIKFTIRSGSSSPHCSIITLCQSLYIYVRKKKGKRIEKMSRVPISLSRQCAVSTRELSRLKSFITASINATYLGFCLSKIKKLVLNFFLDWVCSATLSWRIDQCQGILLKIFNSDMIFELHLRYKKECVRKDFNDSPKVIFELLPTNVKLDFWSLWSLEIKNLLTWHFCQKIRNFEIKCLKVYQFSRIMSTYHGSSENELLHV